MTFSSPPGSAPFRLFTARKALGKTQDEFGAPMGYAKAAVSAWEKGKVEISTPLAQAIQLNWGISWPWLINGEGDPWVPKVTQAAPATLNHQVEACLVRPETDETFLPGPDGRVHEPAPFSPAHAIDKHLADELLRESGGGKATDLYFHRCLDESMEPTIQMTERVLINASLDCRAFPRLNSIYLVRPSPESTQVRLRRVRISENGGVALFLPDNHSFAPTVLELKGIPIERLVIGCACWVGRRLINTETIECVW